MSITQGLKRAMQINGRGTATIFGTRRRTWQEFGERVAKLAGALRGLGLDSGGRVAILALNSDRYLECYYAIPWAGGVVVPLNVRLAPAELIYTLNDAGAEILVVDAVFKAMLPAFSGKLDTVRRIIFADDAPAPEGALNYEQLLSAADLIPDAMRGGEDVAGIFYTGGTTGQAKGVMLTHNNLISNAMNVIAALHYNQEVVYLHVAPMFHLADGSSTFGVTMSGGMHAFIPKFDPADTLRAIQDYHVTHAVLVPTMINIVVNSPAVQDYDVSSLRKILYGASPMPSALIARALQVLPACGFAQGYGMTELSPVATLLDAKYHTLDGPLAGKLRSAGQPAYSVEVMIVDPDDHEVPHGVVGEIVVLGPNVMKGYWNKPEATAQALRGGWMHTGDAGSMDEDGFVYIVDRLKDMIISGGENVYSAEVENAIYQHPAVAMCAVVGIPSEAWGEAVHAIVVPKEGQVPTEDAIIAHCKELIAGYKCPRSVEIRQEALPLSGAGKILKSELRRPFWEGHERQVT
ncbi:MAG TPA: long-chain-fatty-acid--CoA ligase [Roseiflexaceae bacterium]|nr:long-chain-fatty-acid--CoA ligase [Roseiflexaceae bacterium]